MPSTSTGASSIDAGSFQAFFDSWMVRHENFVDELLRAQETYDESREDAIRDLISRVLAHFQEYYQEKSRMIHLDVFLLFSPPWFTALERTFFWIAGFRPELVFCLLMSSVNDLTEDQTRRIQRLRHDAEMEEELLAEELASVQESVAAPPAAELARQVGRRVVMGGGEIRDLDAMPETLRSKMESLLSDADSLRRRIVLEVGEILNPVQNVRFLGSAIKLHLRIRVLGRQREAEWLQQVETNGW
ncbi:RESPONSE TO ABA AND SALT 1 [Abeliophyllum distichum]|uniref:RESPONSE TO ABA AND SALT 1 n=1 Tax=Abeliophyllum distichum TaxID=126358 RepID=A0ABD1VW18_9LAMI